MAPLDEHLLAERDSFVACLHHDEGGEGGLGVPREETGPIRERAMSAKRRRIFLMRHGSVTYFDASGKPFSCRSRCR